MRTTRSAWITAPLALLAAASVLAAQTPLGQPKTGETPAPAAAPAPAGWTLSFTPRGEYTFPADMRSSGARASVARAGLDFDATGPLGDRARLVLSADTEGSWYHFKDFGTLLPGGRDPFGSMYLVHLQPGIAYGIDRQWSVVGGGIAEFAGQSGVDIGDAATFGGYGAVGYRFSEDLSLTLGVSVKSRLKDDALVSPVIVLHWKIDEKLSLALEWPEARLTARIDDQFSASIFGRYELRDYRLKDDGPVPGGVVQDSRAPMGVELTWSPRPGFSVTLGGGVVVYQRFEFLDSGGNKVAADKTRPAPFVALRAEIRF